MNKIFLISIISLFVLPAVVSAMQIQFYYHPTCSHCQNVIPTIQNLMKEYTEPCFVWKTYDTSQTSYNIQGVPLIKIKTFDNRNIEITGDTSILKQLPCELQQMTTKECPTYPAKSNHKGSWFVS